MEKVRSDRLWDGKRARERDIYPLPRQNETGIANVAVTNG